MVPQDVPPLGFLTTNGLDGRLALLERLDSWLILQPITREISHYVDVELLTQPASAVFPKD